MSSADGAVLTAWSGGTRGLGGLRRRNIALVARTVFTHGTPARAEIAKFTGLSPTSVTKITSQLVRARLLAELPAQSAGDAGRPRVPVALDPDHHRFLGIHIGLRRTTGGLLTLSGDVTTQHVRTHRGRGRGAILEEVRAMREELIEEAGGPDRVLGVGLATGGRVDPTRGLVVEHPLLGWRDVALAREVGGSERPVFVDSSVRALALAETYFGHAREADSSVFLFAGNIVGAGMMLDGRIRQGNRAAAGNIEHLPLGLELDGGGIVRCHLGHRDCLAAVASDVAVLARAREAGLVGPRASFDALVSRSRAGCEASTQLLRQRAGHVGVAAGVLIDLLDPDLLVLGGGLLETPEHLDALRSSAVERTGRESIAERIVPTGLGERPLVRGAASLVLDAFFADPVALVPAALSG
jgi:predicted NBD/HSP70 family sugar kinase